MANDISIRLITPADYQAVLDVYAPYIQDTATSFEYDVPSLTEFTDRIHKIISFYPWLVVRKDNTTIGYAYAQAHGARQAYQWSAQVSVYIAEKYHHKGIGRKLYVALFQILRLQRIVNVYAGITLPNEKSEAFHRSIGFQPVGIYERVGYKMGKWHDVLWLSFLLSDRSSNPEAPLSIRKVMQLAAFKNIFS